MVDQNIRLVSPTLTADISDRIFLFLLLSGVFLLIAVLVPHPDANKILLGAGVGMLGMALFGVVLQAIERFESLREDNLARRALLAELRPAAVSDLDGLAVGTIRSTGRFPAVQPGQAIPGVLGRALGIDPRLATRIASRAAQSGQAEDELIGSETHFALEARRVSKNRLLWCIDQRTGRSISDAHDRVAICSISPDGRIAKCNGVARQLFGKTPSVQTETFEVLTDEPEQVCNVQTSDGCVPARIIELRNDDGWRDIAIIPCAASVRDAQVEIPAKPDLLTVLPVPMLKIGADGDLIDANNEARTILSLEDGNFPPLFELLEGMGRSISDWITDAANGRGLLKPEIVRAVTPGPELFLQITLGRAVENGKTVLVGILNDATELKTLEAQFVQSQKMQAIGQLAGGVAHDFNNLLTAISGHCDLLLLRHDSGDPDYADLIQISQNSNRAASLVGQLLAFSRKQNLKPQSLDLRDTMSDLAHLLNRLIGERIQLDVIHAPGDQVIRADRRQMEQVIVNLVVNSRDAMTDGGHIVVSTRRHILSEELIRDRAHVPPGEYVVIEVKDDGSGIPPDGISKIFEPFYTTKKTGDGTGLGLSTAYGIVKQTGGFIFVDSALGEGTTFSLYFPACEATEAVPDDTAAPAVNNVRPHGGGVVLLVEDEAPVRAFASRALRLRGYSVLEAENAEHALETLKDPDLKVDVFVTDVIMPGLDGPTWVRKALRDRPDIRTVFVSGYSEEGRAEKQARIPNSVFLPKPFSLRQLTTVVDQQFL